MNASNSFDETEMEYSLASTGYLIRFWRSKVKSTAGRRGGKTSTLTLGYKSPIFYV